MIQNSKGIRLTEEAHKEWIFFKKEMMAYLADMLSLLGSLNFLTGKH